MSSRRSTFFISRPSSRMHDQLHLSSTAGHPSGLSLYRAVLESAASLPPARSTCDNITDNHKSDSSFRNSFHLGQHVANETATSIPLVSVDIRFQCLPR